MSHCAQCGLLKAEIASQYGCGARFELETARLGFLEADVRVMGPFEYLGFMHLLVDGVPKL